MGEREHLNFNYNKSGVQDNVRKDLVHFLCAFVISSSSWHAVVFHLQVQRHVQNPCTLTERVSAEQICLKHMSL